MIRLLKVIETIVCSNAFYVERMLTLGMSEEKMESFKIHTLRRMENSTEGKRFVKN